MLYDDTRDGVEHVFGDRIAGLTQDVDGVDLVVGAALGAAGDGLRAA